MKKRILLPSLVLAFALASCGVVQQSSSSISSNASSASLESVETSKWNAEVKANLNQVLETDDIPYFESENYVSEIKTLDGVQVVQIDCSPVDIASAIKTYTASTEAEGWTQITGYDDHIAYKSVSASDDIYLQYYITKESFTFTILAYKVTARYATYPAEEARLLLGGDLPMIEADSYEIQTTYSSVQTPEIIVYANGVSVAEVDSYAESLKSAGYTVTSDSSGLYTAENSETGVRATFYSYDSKTMELLAYNANVWKYGLFVVEEEYGFRLPNPERELEGDYATITTSSGDIFTLYLLEANQDDYTAYCYRVEQLGWTLETDYSTSVDRFYVIGEGDNEHYIRVMYGASYSMIAIAIYY